MLRQFTLSSAIVLFVSATCFAPTPPPPPPPPPPSPPGIVQIEDYVVGASTGIELVHGHQTGQASHTICINNNQAANKICGAWADQGQVALVSQIGGAEGHCAVVDVGQIFLAGGGQTQLVGDCVNPMLQGQEFGLLGTQLVAKSEGAGNGQANHMFAGNQGERAGNPIGAMRESSSTGAFQNAMLGGSPGAAGAVVNEMTVNTTQAQAIN